MGHGDGSRRPLDALELLGSTMPAGKVTCNKGLMTRRGMRSSVRIPIVSKGRVTRGEEAEACAVRFQRASSELSVNISEVVVSF